MEKVEKLLAVSDQHYRKEERILETAFHLTALLTRESPERKRGSKSDGYDINSKHLSCLHYSRNHVLSALFHFTLTETSSYLLLDRTIGNKYNKTNSK